jgi:hypothetical protein
MKVEIFVEGVADKKFIEDYITHINAGVLPSNIKVTDMGGISKLEVTKPEIITNDKLGVRNILILDADEDYTKRKQEIEAFILAIGIQIDYFLFPNSSTGGDLESLLQEIINNNNKSIFDCWDSYEECLSSKENFYSENKKFTTPAKKTKIYAYLEAMLGSSKREKEKIKEKERDYLEKNHWDLDHSFLVPLKSFLSKLL